MPTETVPRNMPLQNRAVAVTAKSDSILSLGFSDLMS
jgi:hypothetical protein